MSLGRTLGIPVRFHMGFSLPPGKEGKITGYHCWADYFIEEDGWCPVDISEADKTPEKKEATAKKTASKPFCKLPEGGLGVFSAVTVGEGVCSAIFCWRLFR